MSPIIKQCPNCQIFLYGARGRPKKINDLVKSHIIEDRKNGLTLKRIAAKYDLRVTTVYNALNGNGYERKT